MTLLLLSVAVLIYILCLYIKDRYEFWNKKHVKGPLPTYIVGNFGKVMLGKESINDCFKSIYDQYPEEKVVGLFRGFTPMLLLRDPELIKYVLIKDFPIFHDRGVTANRSKLSNNLFIVEGETWRILRQKLTPAFTSRKLRDMTPLIEQCASNYINYVECIIEKKMDHEIKSLTSKYTIQVIGSCAFGLHIDTFAEKENDFSIMAKKVFKLSAFWKILEIVEMIIPGIIKLCNGNSDIQDFFINIVKNVIHQREGELMQRKDFMDLMIELKDQGKVRRRTDDSITELEMDDALIAAQAFAFYAAGFEGSSTTMSFMIHELALHQNIQHKVYQEVCRVTEKHDGKLNYEALQEMTYLEQIFDETLRKHTVTGVLFRKAQTNYTLPGTNITIPKGTPVGISVTGINKDAKYFPNPEIFNPDNFSPENKTRLPPCVYMPFGEGPHNCIGMRFAIVQSKMGMAAFLKKFKVEPSEKTKLQVDYDPKSFLLKSASGIWVKISKR